MLLWSGLPGLPEKVLATALVSRIAPRKDDQTPNTGLLPGSVLQDAAAVEVYDASFVDDVLSEDYEASDLLYQSDAYGEYEIEHFGGTGAPRTLGGLGDLEQSSALPVQFLWYAAFFTIKT